MNKKILLTLFLGMFLFSLVSATPLTTFNNSLISESLTFIGNENITRYLKIQDGSYITSGNFNISSDTQIEGTYTSSHFDTGASGNFFPTGITNNGTYIWVADTSLGRIQKYLLNGTYTGSAFSTGSAPLSITNNNEFIWVLTGSSYNIYKYWINGTYTGSSFDTSAIMPDPTGITNNGTYFWIADGVDDEVYKYWINGTYTGSSFDTSGETTAPRGITNNNEFIWISGYLTTEVYKYWINGTYTGSSFDTSGEIANPTGITNNGKYFWMTDFGPDEVYKYEMESDITNPYLLINDINIWNYSGSLNTEEKTINLATTINNYISSAAAVLGYYYVPFVFHSDSLGSITYSSLYFSSYGYDINSIVYDAVALSTSTEVFELNISYDTNEYGLAQASLWYNGTEYASTKTTGGITAEFSNSVQVPTVDAANNFSFYFTISLTNSSGTFDYNTSTYYQTVSPITLHVCDSTYNITAINFSLKEEGTFYQLNGSLEATFRYWSTGLSSLYQEYSFSNTTGLNSDFVFCISPGDENFTTDATISYYASGYDRREYLLDDYSINNQTDNISLYLASTNSTDIFTFTVQDENSNSVSGATIRVQRWDIGTNNFYTVGMVYTSGDGTGIINLRLNDAWYRYQVLYEGTLYLTTDPVKESSTNRILEIVLDQPNPYQQFGEIDYDLTHNNVTNVTIFTYSDSTGAVATGCLQVSQLQGNGTTILYYSCVESTSGTLSYKIIGDGTFIIRGIFRLTDTYGNIEKVVDEIVVQGVGERFTVIGKFGQFISLMLIGTAAFFGVAIGSIPLGLGAIGLALIGVNLMGWLDVSAAVLYGLISIIILIILNLRRKQ